MTSTATREYTAPPTFPVPRAYTDWRRKCGLERTINDLIEDLHMKLALSSNEKVREEYLGYHDAVYDEQAKEGSLSIDNSKAAEMIRDVAKKEGNMRVASLKLATISKALNVVMKRYGVSRSDRRNTVGGSIVPPTNGE